MTDRQNLDGALLKPADQCLGHTPADGTGSARNVTIIFTGEQIAYLNDRMKVARRHSVLPRVGGSSLRRHCTESLHNP